MATQRQEVLSLSIDQARGVTTDVRVNERIRVREIRVIDDDGQAAGHHAAAAGPGHREGRRGWTWWRSPPTAVPPVCRIMDFGKYQYQEQKRAREAKKHQKVIEVKEIKFRPKVDEHDYQFKKKHIERFLADGDKVKATIFFRGREMAHPEIGRRILERLMRGPRRRGDRRDDAAAGRQPDAHDPGEEAVRRRRTRTGASGSGEGSAKSSSAASGFSRTEEANRDNRCRN